jgi:hypothetical protein
MNDASLDKAKAKKARTLLYVLMVAGMGLPLILFFLKK